MCRSDIGVMYVKKGHEVEGEQEWILKVQVISPGSLNICCGSSSHDPKRPRFAEPRSGCAALHSGWGRQHVGLQKQWRIGDQRRRSASRHRRQALPQITLSGTGAKTLTARHRSESPTYLQVCHRCEYRLRCIRKNQESQNPSWESRLRRRHGAPEPPETRSALCA